MAFTCQHCGNPFKAKRSDAKFCSSVCRAHWANGRKKTALASPTDQSQQLTPLPPPAPIQSPPVHYPVFSGFGNPGTSFYEQQYHGLSQENAALREKLARLETEKQIKEQLGNVEPVGKTNELLGSLIEGAKSDLPGTISAIGNLVSSFKSGGGTDFLAGVTGEKKDQLLAIVELLKPQSEQFIGAFLGIAGKAISNPEEFMSALEQGSGLQP